MTAALAVEQTGQMCEPLGPEFRSVQKWNCAARKMIPRSKAQKRVLFVIPSMSVLRRSLGPSRYVVKAGGPPGVASVKQSCCAHGGGAVDYGWRVGEAPLGGCRGCCQDEGLR